MAEIRNAPLYFIIPLKNWKVKNPKRTLFTDANLITENIEKQGKQVVIALLDMFTTREDASFIDTVENWTESVTWIFVCFLPPTN